MFTACEAAKQSNKVACPCAADWKYRGEDYSFCADPNNGGFLWCATQTDEVGGRVIIYISKLKKKTLTVSFSKADLVLKPATKYSTYPRQDGNYVTGQYARCTSDIAETCEAEQEVAEAELAAAAADEAGSACPCVAGGQWSYEGERQSYCQKPQVQWQ